LRLPIDVAPSFEILITHSILKKLIGFVLLHFFPEDLVEEGMLVQGWFDFFSSFQNFFFPFMDVKSDL
jgi:ABC-type antimicrobial peptide transport system permease subunit